MSYQRACCCTGGEGGGGDDTLYPVFEFCSGDATGKGVSVTAKAIAYSDPISDVATGWDDRDGAGPPHYSLVNDGVRYPLAPDISSQNFPESIDGNVVTNKYGMSTPSLSGATATQVMVYIYADGGSGSESAGVLTAKIVVNGVATSAVDVGFAPGGVAADWYWARFIGSWVESDFSAQFEVWTTANNSNSAVQVHEVYAAIGTTCAGGYFWGDNYTGSGLDGSLLYRISCTPTTGLTDIIFDPDDLRDLPSSITVAGISFPAFPASICCNNGDDSQSGVLIGSVNGTFDINLGAPGCCWGFNPQAFDNALLIYSGHDCISAAGTGLSQWLSDLMMIGHRVYLIIHDAYFVCFADFQDVAPNGHLIGLTFTNTLSARSGNECTTDLDEFALCDDGPTIHSGEVRGVSSTGTATLS